MKINAFKCEVCSKIFESESEYNLHLKSHSDDYELVKIIQCSHTDTIKISYNELHLSSVIESNGELFIEVSSDDSESSTGIAVESSKIDEIIEILTKFKTAYLTESLVRNVMRGDGDC